MDAFSLIQHFFTQLQCQFCDHSFAQRDIELLRKEEGVFVVNVFCHQCNTQNGIALVGLESASGTDLSEMDLSELSVEEIAALHRDGEPGNIGARMRRKYGFADPELTETELERLSIYNPVSANDVIDAHHFFQGLDSDWMRFIPEEMRQSQTVPHTESPDA